MITVIRIHPAYTDDPDPFELSGRAILFDTVGQVTIGPLFEFAHDAMLFLEHWRYVDLDVWADLADMGKSAPDKLRAAVDRFDSFIDLHCDGDTEEWAKTVDVTATMEEWIAKQEEN